MFKAAKMAQMTTPFKIQKAESKNVLGQNQKKYIDVPYTCFGNWSSYTGNETEVNGITVIEESNVLTTWFDPNFEPAGRVIRLTDNAIFEILSVENVEQRNMYSIVRLKRIKGGA